MKHSLSLLVIAAIACCASFQANAQLKEFYDSECGCTISDNYYDTGVLSSRKKIWKDENKVEEYAFYPDRTLQMERNWKDGKLHGTNSHYHANGNLYYKEYHDMGKPVGTWEYRDDQGDINMSIEHGEGGLKTYTYFSAGAPYFRQVIANEQVEQETVLNEEIYQAKLEEQEALKNAKK